MKLVRQPFCSILVALCLLLLAVGCSPREESPNVTVAPGVVFSRDKSAGVQILDIDLLQSHVRPTVVAANVARRGGASVGDCKTVRDWADANGALGGLNGGYFGQVYDQVGLRKQLIGLAATDGIIVAPSRYVTPNGHPEIHLVRSCVGFNAEGTPDITWATGTPGEGLRRYSGPINPARSGAWRVSSAVMCGPRLFVRGERRITDREEWLVSTPKVPRAFIAYDWEMGRPRHMILGRADAMDYPTIAAYLTDYFARIHSSTPREGMCLDGGPSAQLVYRDSGTLQDAVSTGVLVPTAILILPTATKAP